MDLKDAETGSNNVVESFGVDGIPAKFVLDEKGNIRFSITGFAGSDEAAVEERAPRSGAGRKIRNAGRGARHLVRGNGSLARVSCRALSASRRKMPAS